MFNFHKENNDFSCSFAILCVFRDQCTFQVESQLYEQLLTPGFLRWIVNFTNFHARYVGLYSQRWKVNKISGIFLKFAFRHLFLCFCWNLFWPVLGCIDEFSIFFFAYDANTTSSCPQSQTFPDNRWKIVQKSKPKYISNELSGKPLGEPKFSIYTYKSIFGFIFFNDFSYKKST